MGKAARLIAIGAVMAFQMSTMTVLAQAADLDSVPKLPTVQLRSRGAGVHARGDTVEYAAAKYAAPEVRKVQDLLARLEGFSVSPDGHVHFNGREIETILLNGEDMTGSNYRLLSRYLRAGLVKTVQVIRDYDPDPLMRSIRRSGKIGLSLVLYDSLTRSLSGGVDIGATASGRKDLDLHGISLRGKQRSILLGKWNGTGETVTGNRDFYLRDEQQGVRSQTLPDRSSPVQVGIIHPPSLPEAYVRDNDDLTGSIICKQKIADGRQMGMVMGFDRTHFDREQWKTSRFTLPDGSNWTMEEREREQAMTSDLFLRTEYTEDRGQRGHGHWELDLHAGRSSDAHEDDLSGALEDRMREHDGLKNIRVSGRFRESWSMPGGALLLTGSLSWKRERQLFTVHGLALTGIGVDSLLEQRWDCQEARKDILLQYVSSKRKSPGAWGIRYRGWNGQRASDREGIGGPSGSISFLFHTMTLEKEWERKVGRNGRFMGSLEWGLGSWRVGSADIPHFGSLYDVFAGYSHQAGPFQAWSLSYRDVRSQPEEKYLLPLTLVSGRYTLISPQRQWTPSSLHQFDINFHTRSLAAGTAMTFLFRYSIHRHQVLPAVEMAPGVTHLIPILSDRSDDLHINVGGEVYWASLRMKLNGNLHGSLQKGRAMVNDIWSDRNMINRGLNLRLSSGWTGKFNMEATLNLDNSRYSDRSMMSARSVSYWASTLRIKLRYRWNARWYGAASCERFSMPGLPSFLATDVFLTWQCHERLSFSMTGHNLLDLRQTTTRWVGPDSEGETKFRVVPAYLIWKVSWALG